jgi:hypothetical protein
MMLLAMLMLLDAAIARMTSRPQSLGVATNKHHPVLCKRQLAATDGTTSSRSVMSGVFP